MDQLKNRGLEIPLIQGGMGVGVSLSGLAGAVAKTGAMGCISTADIGKRTFAVFPRKPIFGLYEKKSKEQRYLAKEKE